MSQETSNDLESGSKPLVAPTANEQKTIIDAILSRLARIDAAVTQLSGSTAKADLKPPAVGRTIPIVVWAAVGGIAAISIVLILSLGLAVVQFRQAQVAELDAKAKALETTLEHAEAEIKDLKQSRRGLDELIQKAETVRGTFNEATTAANTAVQRVNTLGVKIENIEQQVSMSTGQVEKRLHELESNLAADIGKHVATAYSQPVQDMGTTLRDLSTQIAALRERVRRPARPERTAVVVFDSAAQRADNSRDTLRRLFCDTLLRSGFEGYQIALYQASGGRLVNPPRVPFGDEPAHSQPFADEWTTMDGTTERTQDLDPKPIFSAIPAEMPKRLVLIVSGQAESPALDSIFWPIDVQVHAVIVGSRDPKKLDAWKRFCEKRRGEIRVVENTSEPLLKALKDLTQPSPSK